MITRTRLALAFFFLALLYAGPGLLPGHTAAPVDVPLDYGAWKSDPTQRIRVANSLLSDIIVQFIPWDREVRRLAASGEFPWVSEFAGDGGTLFANPQASLLSPFTWPRLLFDLDGWALMILLKVLAAAVGAYWMARELEVDPAAALLSAIVFATAGASVVWLLWPHTSVSAFLPFLGAAGLRLMRQPDLRGAALVIVFAALCTVGGHPETLFIGVASLWVFFVWEAERRPGLRLLAVVPPSIGAFLGFLLASVQLVPFFFILSNSHDAALRPQLEHGFRGWAVLSQIVPGILGSPLRSDLDLTAIVTSESFNHRTGGFIGAIVLLALIVSRRALNPSLRRGLIIGTLALIVSWYPPGVWSLARHVPLFRVTALEYFALPFVLFGALAAGPALFALAERGRRKVGLLLLIAGIAGVIGGVLPSIPASEPLLRSAASRGIATLRERGHLQHSAEIYEERFGHYLSAARVTTLRRLALPASIWVVAGCALLFANDRRRRLLVAGAAAAELLAFGFGFNPGVPMTDIAAEPPLLAEVRSRDPQRQFLLASHFEVLPANLATLYRTRDVISYGMLNLNPRIEEITRAGYDPKTHSLPPLLSPEQVTQLERLGTRFVLSRAAVPGAARIAGEATPRVGLYELPNATPRRIPPNERPRGLATGIALTCFAALAAAGWLQLYRLPAPISERRDL